jgi:hypothetical protein
LQLGLLLHHQLFHPEDTLAIQTTCFLQNRLFLSHGRMKFFSSWLCSLNSLLMHGAAQSWADLPELTTPHARAILAVPNTLCENHPRLRPPTPACAPSPRSSRQFPARQPLFLFPHFNHTLPPARVILCVVEKYTYLILARCSYIRFRFFLPPLTMGSVAANAFSISILINVLYCFHFHSIYFVSLAWDGVISATVDYFSMHFEGAAHPSVFTGTYGHLN